MHTAAYDAWIASLPDDARQLVQAIMARVGVLLDSRANDIHADIQRNTRRLATQSERLADLNTRLDHYETRQWTIAQEAIAQFMATQLPLEERDALIQQIYQLATEIEAMKSRQVNGDAT